ncbi:hypothetical protein PG993_008621 [Apiospora rasikravindrae]|uniref:Uncharacterized protein n=1 Tax=Apiospora rasikravindrae TaxID=990691 RepID=A0ABR1T0V7_9PEZI
MASRFLFGGNLPNANNIPQWLQTVDAKVETVIRELNRCQDGQKDIAEKLGSNADLQDKVADLAARISVGRESHQRLHDDLQTKLDTMTRADETAQRIQGDDPQYLDNWAAKVAPVAKHLLPSYLALFGDMNLIRDISDEHKVLLYNKELATLQIRYDALEARLDVPVIPDSRDFVPTSRLEESQLAKSAAEKSLEEEQVLRRQEAAAASGRISQLQEEADINKTKLDNLKTDLEEAQQGYAAERDAARAAHGEEMRKQQKAQEHLQEVLGERDSSLTVMRNERDALQIQLSALQNRNQELTAAQSQIGRDQEDVQIGLDNALLELEEHRIRHQTQEETIRRRDEEISELQAKVADYEKQVDDKSKAWDSMKDLHDGLHNTLQKANLDLETCRIQLGEATNDIKGLNDTNNTLSAQYNSLFTQTELLKQDKDNLEASSAAQAAAFQKEKCTLLEHYDILNMEYDVLDGSRSALWGRIIDLESDTFGLDLINEEQKEHAQRLSTAHRYALTLLANANQTLQKLRANVFTLTRENRNLRAQAGTIETDLERSNSTMLAFIVDVCDVPHLHPQCSRRLLKELTNGGPSLPTSHEIPRVWTVQQPWGPSHGTRRPYPFSATMGAGNLTIRLYDRISRRQLTRGSFLLLEMLMQTLTEPVPTVYPRLINMLLGCTLAALPTVPDDADTQLFCVGLIQLLALVERRFDKQFVALPQLRAFVRNSQPWAQLWDTIDRNDADQVRRQCLDTGVHNGRQSLIALTSDRILVVDHAARTLRLIDAELLLLKSDLQGCVRAPPAHTDIILPIDGPVPLAWWLQYAHDTQTDL